MFSCHFYENNGEVAGDGDMSRNENDAYKINYVSSSFVLFDQKRLIQCTEFQTNHFVDSYRIPFYCEN